MFNTGYHGFTFNRTIIKLFMYSTIVTMYWYRRIDGQNGDL